jgi:hypothetical protein
MLVARSRTRSAPTPVTIIGGTLITYFQSDRRHASAAVGLQRCVIMHRAIGPLRRQDTGVVTYPTSRRTLVCAAPQQHATR